MHIAEPRQAAPCACKLDAGPTETVTNILMITAKQLAPRV